MKKYIIAGAIIAAFVAYIFIFNNKGQQPVTTEGSPSTTPPTSTPSSSPVGAASGSGSSGSGSAGATSSSGASGQYKDGTYTGAVADAFYGNLQVTVTIEGGKITNVQFPQYPQGGHSSDVSAQALPALAQEAISAQDANVNVVSGATQDSQAFQQSLASALSQARG